MSDSPAVPTSPKSGRIIPLLISVLLWIGAGMMVLFMAGVIWVRTSQAQQMAAAVAPTPTPLPIITNSLEQLAPVMAGMPDFQPSSSPDALVRLPNLHTIIPDHPREAIQPYKVEKGDSIFAIARKFNLKPETILWSNDQLNDNPDLVVPGTELKVPPLDGVYYKWKDNDTVENVAATLKVKAQDILIYAPNKLDLLNPIIKAGTYIMVPGGKREFKQWVIPTIARGSKSSTLKNVLGEGACDTSLGGAVGSGSFVWPSPIHSISGNDYWPGHLAIDVSAGMGTAVFAADTGVVVFSGWANGGYGYTIVIDHGNGYQTLYSHLSAVGTSCGMSVSRGGQIGGAGSTGNSTGPHIHFEVRYGGGFVDPKGVLP